ncbi:MAG: hypothetical protein JXX28_07460 [Deltaproteobacteria bacterium]|nr:hypothetical protein [Deltaproteobacteria bacterium]
MFTNPDWTEFPRVRITPDGAAHFDEPSLPRVTLEPLLRKLCRPLSGEGITECQLPLEGKHWLVGRRSAEGSVWRVVGRDHCPTPTCLWASEALLSPDGPLAGPLPEMRPLAELIRLAIPLTGSRDKTLALLAATVEGLRAGRGPLAIRTGEEGLRSQGRAHRWFLLALSRLLPPPLLEELWISSWEASPEPAAWDLVITHTEAPGFTVLDAYRPPAVQDPVARWALWLLVAGDEEALTGLSALWRQGDEDPWAAGLREAFAAGRAGGPRINSTLLREDPEAAVEILTAQLAGGAPLEGAPLVALASVTARTSDPRPWRTLKGRDSDAVGLAVRAWTTLPTRAPLREDLLIAITDAAPSGGGLERFLSEYAEWLDEHPGSDLLEAFGELLGRVATSLETGSLASLWVEWLSMMIERGAFDEQLVLDGGGKALASRRAWGTLMTGWLGIAGELVELDLARFMFPQLASDPEAHRVVAECVTGLVRLGQEGQARHALQVWMDVLSRHPVRNTSAVVQAVRGTPLSLTWATGAATFLRGAELRAGLNAVSTGPRDPIWRTALDARWRDTPPERRLGVLLDFLPDGAAALEGPARGALRDALSGAHLSLEVLGKVGATFRLVPEAAPVWSHLMMCCAGPGQLEEEVLDATALSWCESGSEDLELEARVVRCLARGAGWEPLDYARWTVRFLMAPAVGEPPLTLVLSLELLRALAARGPEYLGEVMALIFELPPGHPALDLSLRQLLPRIWAGPLPQAFVLALGELPDHLAPRIARLRGS